MHVGCDEAGNFAAVATPVHDVDVVAADHLKLGR